MNRQCEKVHTPSFGPSPPLTRIGPPLAQAYPPRSLRAVIDAPSRCFLPSTPVVTTTTLSAWNCQPCVLPSHCLALASPSPLRDFVRRKGSPISHRGRPEILLIILSHPSDPLLPLSALLSSHRLAHDRKTYCPTFHRMTSPKAHHPHVL